MNWRTLTSTVAVVSVILLAIVFFISYRRSRLDRLYAVAMGYSTINTDRRQVAIKELSRDPSQRATELLLKIATNSQLFLWPDGQDAAISALAERRDPAIAVRLADLMQPYLAIGTRRAVAGALSKLPCPADCIRSVLHYKERIWRGEPNFEERLSLYSTYQREQQEEVITLLNSVLIREQTVTLQVLRKIYGLGTENPSLFTLALIRQLRLNSACSELLASKDKILRLSDIGYKGPSADVASAIRDLQCASASTP